MKGFSKYPCPKCGTQLRTKTYAGLPPSESGTHYFCEACGYDRVSVYSKEYRCFIEDRHFDGGKLIGTRP
jgi:predicted RNA-binding Zn-ribbon protein involved in translation (DUF1610 family)